MGKIVLSQNVTLDGVGEDPTGEGGFRHGGWFENVLAAERGPWAAVEYAEAQAAAALLMGRGTDEYFGSRWNDAEGDWADRLRALPKYVVSSTLAETVWRNGTVIKGDVAEEVQRLKDRVDGEIVVYASRPLVHALFENDLVDEIRLFVFPVIAGTGERIFDSLSDKVTLRRTGVEAVGESLVHQTYEVVR